MRARVRLRIGAVDVDLARAWLDNSLAILAAVRSHAEVVPFVLDEPLLDLCEAYLRLWREHAAVATSFDWAADVDPEHVAQLARQWVLIASLEDVHLAKLGIRWAPEATAPFYAALLAGTVDALEQDPATAPLARDRHRGPPGSRS